MTGGFLPSAETWRGASWGGIRKEGSGKAAGLEAARSRLQFPAPSFCRVSPTAFFQYIFELAQPPRGFKGLGGSGQKVAPVTGAVRSALQGTARLLGGNLGARHLPSQLRLEKRRIHPGAACSEGKSLTEEGEGRGERLVGLGVRTEPRLGPTWVSHAHPGTQNGGGGIGRGG